MANTPCSQCRGPRFYPRSGNEILQATTKSLHVALKIPHAATKTQHSQINIKKKKKGIKLSKGKDLGILFAAVFPVAGTK